MIVEVNQLTKVFSARGRAGVPALSGVSFALARGACVGVVGGNGSGKSTLLKVLAGLVEPTSGTVAVRGRAASLIELGAGFDPEYTGRENVRLVGTVLGLSERERAAREPEILAFAGLGDAIDRPVRGYSSGMFMRLAFSLATHVDADVLLVDEVLAVGDARFRARCRERLEAFRRAGGTLVLAAHDLAPLSDFCDRALWLHNGVLRADGPPRQVIGQYLEQVGRDAEDASPAAAVGTRAKLAASGAARPSEGLDPDASRATPEVGDARRDREPQEDRAAAESDAGAARCGAIELHVELQGADGQGCAAFAAEDALVARIRYRTARTVERPVFGLVVNRADWTCAFGSESAVDGLALGALPVGDGAVSLTVAPLGLTPGQYAATVSLRDGERVLALRVASATFEVIGSARPGIFRPTLKWGVGA